jgi:2-polyprenyl-6-methoxyphenol hydroxylase-like FAD-dependent oxidoreductase
MAMESAAVLADELSRTDSLHVEHALTPYAKRRQRHVEAMQDDSRKVAKLMLMPSRAIAGVRNLARRFYPLESLAEKPRQGRR